MNRKVFVLKYWRLAKVTNLFSNFERFAKSLFFRVCEKRRSPVEYWFLSGILLLALAACQSNSEPTDVTLEAIETAPEAAETAPEVTVASASEPTGPVVVEGEEAVVRTPGKTMEQIRFDDGTVMDYALVLPDDYTADQRYPILLALPPGGQTVDLVETGLRLYWEAEGAKRGWIMVSPAAPNGTLFFQGSEIYLPGLLDHIEAEFSPEGGKFHVGGVSNG
ncbi:MAG: hypothetical protein WAM60_05920, partial [Candidatus Promineifilaceae bacterium]